MCLSANDIWIVEKELTTVACRYISRWAPDASTPQRYTLPSVCLSHLRQRGYSLRKYLAFSSTPAALCRRPEPTRRTSLHTTCCGDYLLRLCFEVDPIRPC